MVELVGVTHSAWIRDFFMTTTNVSLQPSSAFLSYLERFPEGTRVGIESLSKDDWKLVREDLYRKNYEIDSKYERSYAKSYGRENEYYWDALVRHLKNIRLEVIYLENINAWFEINNAIVKDSMIRAKVFNEILFREEDESEIDYTKKLMACNEMIHQAELNYRKLHEQGRDSELLKEIAKNDLNVAVVGLAHSDFWYSIKEKINQIYKFNFEKYNVDKGLFNKRGNCEMIFTENAEPIQEIIVEINSLEKLLLLQETGRLVPDKKPDYAGTFNTTHPSEGYFELFLDSKTTGSVVDYLGIATVEGIFTDEKIEFTKTYNNAISNAMKGQIKYKARKREGMLFNMDDFFGRYMGNNGGSIFYMTKNLSRPFDLSLVLNIEFIENPKFFEQFNFKD